MGVELSWAGHLHNSLLGTITQGVKFPPSNVAGDASIGRQEVSQVSPKWLRMVISISCWYLPGTLIILFLLLSFSGFLPRQDRVS